MENNFLKLTNTVYKVLEFFPESDPLKNRAKDRALLIMEHLISIDENSGWASFQKDKIKTQLLEDIDILLGYLWIGKTQGWLNSSNCLIISNEYEKIKKEIEPIVELTQKLPGIEDVMRIKDLSEMKTSLAKATVGEEESCTQIVSGAVLNNTEKKTPTFHLSEKQKKPVQFTTRQRKIVEFLEKNERAQVMDLQTVLPDITKRTIRRDLDELLESGKIIRQGDFNQIFYKINEPQRSIEVMEG